MRDPRAGHSPVLAGPAVAAALSRTPGEAAAHECVERLFAGLEAARGSAAVPVDLAAVFLAPAHAELGPAIGRIIQRGLHARALVGVSGGGVIAGSLESEGGPGVAVLAASLPGVRLTAFCSADLPLAFGPVGPLDADPDEPSGIDHEAALEASDVAHLAQVAGFGPDHRGTLLFADPFSTRADRLLAGLSAATAATLAARGPADPLNPLGAPVIGGLASASGRPGRNILLLNDRAFREGVVGVSLAGHLRVDPLVSQGCRGFGPNMIVTKAEGQVIEQVGGRPVLDVLHEAIEDMGPAERQLLARGLFIGRVVNEYKERFGRDDYLIRTVAGVLKNQRAIAVADEVRVGQTVRFHARDAQTASEDLAMLLDAQSLRPTPAGALLVSCNGRGSRLFSEPHHDANTLARLFDPRDTEPGEQKAKSGRTVEPAGRTPPVAGFFAAGEFGPVGDAVFLHGQTASAALFRPL